MLDFHLLISVDRRFYVANPASSFTLTPPEHPWTRDAAERDVTLALSQHDVELVDTLSKSYAEHELTSVLEALGLGRAYLEHLRRQEASGEATLEQAYFRTTLCAVMTEAIIERHGAVATPAIQNASLTDLRIWEEHYFGQLTEIFAEQRSIEATITSGSFCDNAGWALCRARFNRIAGFLFEVRSRLGVNIFTGEIVRAPSQT